MREKKSNIQRFHKINKTGQETSNHELIVKIKKTDDTRVINFIVLLQVASYHDKINGETLTLNESIGKYLITLVK